MATKRYIAHGTAEYSTYITLPNGKRMMITFGGKDVFTKKHFIDVQDEIIQSALEKNPSFGVYFYLSEVAYKEATVSPRAIEDITFPNVTEAKDWLNKTQGVSHKKMANKGQTYEQFKALGYTLILKSDIPAPVAPVETAPVEEVVEEVVAEEAVTEQEAPVEETPEATEVAEQ